MASRSSASSRNRWWRAPASIWVLSRTMPVSATIARAPAAIRQSDLSRIAYPSVLAEQVDVVYTRIRRIAHRVELHHSLFFDSVDPPGSAAAGLLRRRQLQYRSPFPQIAPQRVHRGGNQPCRGGGAEAIRIAAVLR